YLASGRHATRRTASAAPARCSSPTSAMAIERAMSALLGVDDLHARYGDSHVLRGVTLQVAAGRSLGLLGRHCIGTTTLIRTALGYVRASGGRVAWQGRAMTGAPPERMARLGV